MDIRAKLRQAVERYGLLQPKDRVLVAVSGGQDSVALATLLAELREPLTMSLVIGHLHHGLRGTEADADQARVERLASELDCECVVEQQNVATLAKEHGVGVEVAGRQARYDFFERTAAKLHCTKVALGHTATDRAETLLMNLMRGTGLRGMASIPPHRGKYIRPLILVTRQETGEFCRSQGLEVCIDSCNDDNTYRRNRVRAQLIPQLEAEYGPGIEAALCRASEHVWEELEWTEPLVNEALEHCRIDQGLRLATLASLPKGLQQRVLRAFLSDVQDISAERWEALADLIRKGQTGKRVELPGGRSVCLDYGVLRGDDQPALDLWPGEIILTVPGETSLPDGRRVVAEITPNPPQKQTNVAVLDAVKAGTRLVFRLPRPGDHFVPSGMTGHKKLQDFFVDTKVPRRNRQPLIVLGNGELLWVVGHRLAETARPTIATKTYLVLTVH